MKILLLGKLGQLGWELQRALSTLGQVIALDYPEIDFTSLEDLRRLVLDVRPQAIVNAVAYTAVDKAEQEADLADKINGIAPGILAEAAMQVGAVLVHYSTDFVFDGNSTRPYVETDSPNPLSAYGRSKLLGEQAVERAGGSAITLRTSWMYSPRRDNFLKKVLEWSRTRPSLRIVTDQVGSPTSARMLAEATAQMLAQALRGCPSTGSGRSEDNKFLLEWFGERSGIYHLGGEGIVSRYDWALRILQDDLYPEQQVVKEVLPALSSDFPLPALRPAYSALNCDRFAETFGLRLPPWQEAQRMVIEEIHKTVDSRQ